MTMEIASEKTMPSVWNAQKVIFMGGSPGSYGSILVFTVRIDRVLKYYFSQSKQNLRGRLQGYLSNELYYPFQPMQEGAKSGQIGEGANSGKIGE